MLLWTLEFMYLFELVFSFSSAIYPAVELLDHMIVLFLVFEGTSTLFSIVATPIYISPTVYKCSLFSTSSLTFVICGLFDDSHSGRCEMISHCGFDLHFSDDWWCWAPFVSRHHFDQTLDNTRCPISQSLCANHSRAFHPSCRMNPKQSISFASERWGGNRLAEVKKPWHGANRHRHDG